MFIVFKRSDGQVDIANRASGELFLKQEGRTYTDMNGTRWACEVISSHESWDDAFDAREAAK